MAEEPADHRVISRDLSPDHRIVAVVRASGEADDMTDDEILDGLQQWRKPGRLRVVDE
ncbi:hypothetical protein ACFRIB_38290 [Streptomyces mirabilis]|uniref:hypothetical protein n=1 Tax=Streptomyces mirabilis TaxID=68239 RepID=UPI0036884293